MNRPGLLVAPLVALATALTVVTLPSPPSQGAPLRVDRPGAIVTLGDSYLSGEGGRWAGNSPVQTGDRRGSDRAPGAMGDRDLGVVYVDGTDGSGCHRSDVAPVLVTGAPAETHVNLACSGATAADVRSAARGGTPHRGERPQADQLAELAAERDVDLVVVSIGGNDIGFGRIILDCALAYATTGLWFSDECADEQGERVEAVIDTAMDDVAAAVADVRRVLDRQGDHDARVVVASYPSPVPAGDDLRYRSRWERLTRGGCPFWDDDATWARRTLVPRLADELAAVADRAGVGFLDLSDLFEGREVCAEGAAHADGTPDGHEVEWVRFLTTGLLQGGSEESLHPNAFGQAAIGRCIGLLAGRDPATATADRWRCENTPGRGPEAVVLHRAPA